jgi:undecaprenyl-diphosphatase
VGIFESIVYGFVSGLAEVFPVSAQANQMVMRQLFGIAHKESIRDLLVHIAVLAGVLFACRAMFTKIRREQAMAYRMRRNPSQIKTLKGVYDMRLVSSALPVMLIGLFLNLFLGNFYSRRPLFCLMLLVNGALTMIPVHMHQGNRDARSLTNLDGILVGLAAALSAIPGISRNSAIMFVTLTREADKQNGLNWALILTVPAMAMMVLVDFISIFTVGIGAVSLMTVLGYFLSAFAAFAGAYCGVSFIRMIIKDSDYGGFAYYDFGLALFSFALYLIA